MYKRSLINKYFSKDLLLDLYRVTITPGLKNEEKCGCIKALLTDYGVPFQALGPGTNRMAVMIESYAVKIALDKDGMIDNRREILYTKKLQPYVIKVYECVPNGLVAVSEYVTFFESDDFERYRGEMKKILQQISSMGVLIGDVGITRKNYVNWGIRRDGTNQIVMLDFAYIYSVKFNMFKCTCTDSSYLDYDGNFVKLVCPKCGTVYDFTAIRRRISKEQQEQEIGDIRRLSYNMTVPEADMVEVKEFKPMTEAERKKAKKNNNSNSLKQIRKRHRQLVEEEELEGYYD